MSGHIAGISLQDAGPNKGTERKTEAVKVKRYFPGQKPDFAGDSDGESSEEDDVKEEETPAPYIDENDPRLRRLAAAAAESKDDAAAMRREIRRAEIIKAQIDELKAEAENREKQDIVAEGTTQVHEVQHEEEVEEDDEAIARRRERLRKAMQEQEAAAQAEEEFEEEDEDDDEFESEDESDEDDSSDDEGLKLAKPVFIRKDERVTIQEKEDADAALEKEKKASEEAKLSRKQETRQMVVDQLKQEQEWEAGEKAVQADDVDTDDEKADPEAEYDAWKERELFRIRRDRDVREKMEKEREELEKLRSMTAEERAEYERLNPVIPEKKQKAKMNYLQKYYHKGAFFQDDADDFGSTQKTKVDLMGRDFMAPTGEDKMSKKDLPAVMQVKNWGKMSRTKWTHLKKEDTTDTQSPWFQQDVMREKYMTKQGGMKDSWTKADAGLARPKGKRLKSYEQYDEES